MDNSARYVRSRTSSSSSLRSPSTHPATPAHTPNTATLSRHAATSHATSTFNFGGASGHQVQQSQQNHYISPDQLAAGLSRIREELGSRNSSIPPTPAPTPNPLIQLNQHMIPEQLVAGIKQLKVDEGYTDSTSFPATPAPSPFCPSPAQFSAFSPDQVAARLREESHVLGGGSLFISGNSTGQPPTPSTTPGPGAALAHGGHPHLAPNLGIIPEHLADSINNLRGVDEGLDESTSNPATPIQTPISPSLAQQGSRAHHILPEQLAAGIHRLKVEEGMSSGGSSGFPSTPAPTPFCHHPGGVRPEELAAGISRLSVIEEGDVVQQPVNQNPPPIKIDNMSDSEQQQQKPGEASEPNLSQYFGQTATTPNNPSSKESAAAANPEEKNSDQEFFDNFSDDKSAESGDAFLHSCRESRVNLPDLDNKDHSKSTTPGAAPPKTGKAEIAVSAQTTDDEKSLQRRQSQDQEQKSSSSRLNSTSSDLADEPKVCSIFKSDTGAEGDDDEANLSSAFDNIEINKRPTSLPPQNPITVTATPATPTTVPSSYATPAAPTPVTPIINAESLAYSTYVMTPVIPGPSSDMTSQQQSGPSPSGIVPFTPTPSSNFELPVNDEESNLPIEARRRRDAWLPSSAVLKAMGNSNVTDANLLTSPNVQGREELNDPVRNLVHHYRGEAEAAKRTMLTANDVSQDLNGLRQLIAAGCLRSAVNLTTRLLSMCNQGPGQRGQVVQHTPASLQVWHVRISLLIKLKQFNTVENEAAAFGDLDKVDLYYEHYPADQFHGQKGCMAPFAFRLLLAELPLHLGKYLDAFDRLYSVLAIVNKIIDNLTRGKLESGENPGNGTHDLKASLQLWTERKTRVLYSLVNVAVQQKDYELASRTLDEVFDLETIPERKSNVRSTQGRVFLQLGDLMTAMKFFEEAAKLRPDKEDALNSLVDKACLSIASNNYIEAYEFLSKANERTPNNAIVINNMSVCLLYLGRLKEALSLLETNLTANPETFLQDTPILNLATLYELESSYAGQKKQSLLDLMSRYSGDGANTASLKF